MSVVRRSLVEAVEKAITGIQGVEDVVPTPGARLERLGTIFSRMTGLIKSEVLPKSEIPAWYHVYQTFPPKFEPVYKRPPFLNIKIQQIFYPEDELRAKMTYNKEVLNLLSNEKTETQKKVEEFRILKKNHPDDSNEALINQIIRNKP